MSLQKLPRAVITTAFPAGRCQAGGEGALPLVGRGALPLGGGRGTLAQAGAAIRSTATCCPQQNQEGGDFIQLLPLLETSEMYQAQQCIWYFSPRPGNGASPRAQRKAKTKR